MGSGQRGMGKPSCRATRGVRVGLHGACVWCAGVCAGVFMGAPLGPRWETAGLTTGFPLFFDLPPRRRSEANKGTLTLRIIP